MRIVGLTGGIGSGKTTVAKMFEELGVPVYNSDIQAKRLMQSSAKIKNKIKDVFGPQAYIDGTLNRAYLAKLVFNNKELLQKLNAIVHPEVRKHFLKWAEKQDSPYVIQEVAIIFENSSESLYDKIILVTAPEEHRLDRVMERDGGTKADIMARMANQWKDVEKVPLSDFVVENLDLEETRLKIKAIHGQLLDRV